MAETTKTPSIRETMELLNEASLKDLAKSAGNKVKAAAGDKKAKGSEETKRLAKHMKGLYSKWLGQTGEEATEESLMKFLVSKIGFTAANARKIFDKANIQDPTKNESVMEALKRVDIDNVLLHAAQFAFAYDLVDSDDDDDDDKVKGAKGSDRRGNGSRSYSRRSSRYGSRGYNDEGDILQGLRPDTKKASALSKQAVLKQAYSAGLEDEHLDELADLVGEVKSYSDITKLKDSDDYIGMLSRLGYAYIRSQQGD